MAKSRVSTKQLAINKDKARIALAVVAASSLFVFSGVASINLVGKIIHQNKVISAKSDAKDQLEENAKQLKELRASYDVFDQAPESIMGNSGEKNSKVVLDALPSKYDYAALLSSIENIATQGGYSISQIAGQDESLQAEQSSSSPTPVDIPLAITFEATYPDSQKILNDFYRSIRPFSVQALELSGSDDLLTINMSVLTQYQPQRNFDLGQKEIK